MTRSAGLDRSAIPTPWLATSSMSSDRTGCRCPDRRGRTRSSSAGTAACRRCSARFIPPPSRAGRRRSQREARQHQASSAPDVSTGSPSRPHSLETSRGEAFHLMFLPFALLMAAQTAEAPSAPGAADCSSHMVEIPVMMTSKGGLPKQSKVKICGTLGQTDAEWARTLRDALAKVETDGRMSASVKDQIVSGLKIEIAKLPSAAASAKAPPAVGQIASTPSPAIVPPAAGPIVKPVVETGRVEYSAL